MNQGINVLETYLKQIIVFTSYKSKLNEKFLARIQNLAQI